MLGLVGTVTFLRADRKLKGITRLLALNLRLELRDEHMSAVNIVQRLLFGGLVCKFSFYSKLVSEHNYFVFRNFHICYFILCRCY